MSYYAIDLEVSFEYPASSVTRANGGFSNTSSEVIGRAVQKGTGNTVVLCAAGARPMGVILRLDTNTVAIGFGPILKIKRAGTDALAVGSRVTGATWQESASGSAERGFIAARAGGASPSGAQIDSSTGYVLDGGPTNTANMPAPDAEILMW